MLHYPDCTYNYSIGILRAIEESYKTGHIVVGWREREVSDWKEFAEHRADYERACKYVKVKVGIRTDFSTICQMTDYLNGGVK